MTAEVAIVNANAVAIAADSAVTIGRGRKIYNSAIKVFALSKVAPVGAMVYGNAELLGVPLETIVKTYRAHLKARTFDCLHDYADDFLRFLGTDKGFFPRDLQDSWVESNVWGYFDLIRREVMSDAENTFRQEGKMDEAATLRIFQTCVNRHHQRLAGSARVKGMTLADEKGFRKRFNDKVRDIASDVFQLVELGGTEMTSLYDIAVYIHTREVFSENRTGIVVCGFGNKDVFPVVATHEIDGVLGNKLKYRRLDRKSCQIRNGADCSIIPFAQDDMVATFMEGINPTVHQFVNQYLHEVFTRLPAVINETYLPGDQRAPQIAVARLETNITELLDEFMRRLDEYKQREHIGPILSMVRVLPKDELAAMAEALVNLTAFKRRMTDELETVGGPIDVAVISKGDGLVWVKRKHYFPRELNQHFFGNYLREIKNDGQKTTREQKTD